jgi:hypothetical protein
MQKSLDRLRFITRNYSGLQGLRMVPLGVTWLILGAMRQWGGETAKIFARGWEAPLTLIAVFSSYLVGRFFYLPRYGHIKLPSTGISTESTKRDRLLATVILLGGLAAVVWATFGKSQPLVDWFVVIAALAMIVVGLNGRFWRHYTILGLTLLVLGIMPGFHLISEQQFHEGVDYFAVGSALAVAGLIDHLILMRLFSAEDTEQSHA